jgi:Glycosyl hydrolases family 43
MSICANLQVEISKLGRLISMSKFILVSAGLVFSVVLSSGLVPSVHSHAAPNMATNPIIWADVPDPAVIRVNDTYYMSSTTMHMSPRLPIMKSPDLVNWQMIGYAYETLGDNDALTLKMAEVPTAQAHGRAACDITTVRFTCRHFPAPPGERTSVRPKTSKKARGRKSHFAHRSMTIRSFSKMTGACT